MNKPTDTQRLDWLQKQFGCALVNDDNGHWALADAGVQNLPDDSSGVFDYYSTFYIEKKFWRRSLRGAIDRAMKDTGWIAPAREETPE